MSDSYPPSGGGPWSWDGQNGQQGHWPTTPVQQPQQPPHQPPPQQPQSPHPAPPQQPPQQSPQPYLPPAPPPPKRSRAGLFALVAFVVLVVGVGVGWGLTHFLSSDEGTVVAQPSEAPSAESSDSSASDASDDPSGDHGTSAGPDSTEGADELPDDPSEALTQVAETDKEEVVADLEGKWVPQISSKRTGMEIDGETWTDEDILADHQALRDEYPRVRLLWSGDFGSFKEGDFWITIAGIGYSNPEQALSWCATNGLGPDDCYAKQLNTGGDHEGTTRLQ
ncbi:hypothetical protein [Brevibacterium yomogidense]|uniref:hypothetical protein n=1 Tax=Brevibacterium yomogidense TaxID=946573 RepID=UPI0018E00843|nr:hypothetical protein [Brevibacterium yomogidense]